MNSNQNNNRTKQAPRVYLPFLRLIPVCNLSPRLQQAPNMNLPSLPPLPSHLAPPLLPAANTLNRGNNQNQSQYDNNIMAQRNLRRLLFDSNTNTNSGNINCVELPTLLPSITNITASNLPRSEIRRDSPDSVSTLNTFTTTASQITSPNQLYQCKLRHPEIASFDLNHQNTQQNNINNINHNNLQHHRVMNINVNNQNQLHQQQILNILTNHARKHSEKKTPSDFGRDAYNVARNAFKDEAENEEPDHLQNTQRMMNSNPANPGNPGGDNGHAEHAQNNSNNTTANGNADDVDEGLKNESSDHDEYDDEDPEYRIDEDELEQAAAAEYDDVDVDDDNDELDMYTTPKTRKHRKKSSKSSKTKAKKTSKAKSKKSASSSTSSTSTQSNVTRASYDANTMRPIPTGPFSVKYEDICEEYIKCDLCSACFDESNGARVAYIEHYKKHCEKNEMRDYLRCVKPGCSRYGKKSKHISNFISHLTTEKHNEYTKGPFICKVYLLNENSGEWEKCGHSSTTEANLCKHVYDTHYKHTFDPHKEFRFNKRYGWHRVAWAEAERLRKHNEPSSKSKKKSKQNKNSHTKPKSNKNKRKRKRTEMEADEEDEEYLVEDAAAFGGIDDVDRYPLEQHIEHDVQQQPEIKKRRQICTRSKTALQQNEKKKSDDKEEADNDDDDDVVIAEVHHDENDAKPIVFDTIRANDIVCSHIQNEDEDERKYRLIPESQGHQAQDVRTQFSFLAQLCVAESLLHKEF